MSEDKRFVSVVRRTRLPDYVDTMLKVEAKKNRRTLSNQIRIFVERALVNKKYNPFIED